MSDATNSRRHGRGTRFAAWLCTASVVLQTTWSAVALAEPIADPRADIGFRPDVSVTNGVPVVNIAAPSDGGVSHNQYERFDVGPEGVVLNNARQDGESWLAGYLAANPNLTTRSASLILNEVTGASASVLAGDLEVFGSRAEVIIANPDGITCNGCGFINTDRVALIAGAPMGPGATNFTLSDAGVGIGRGGLSTSASVDLIGNQLLIDGPVAAGERLGLVAGATGYDYVASDPEAAASGQAPSVEAYAIDASVYGAMNAGSIGVVVVGENAGVRLAGYASANSGDFSLSANGDVSLRGLDAAYDIDIESAGAVAQLADMAAGGQITVNANAFSSHADGAVQAAEGLVIATENDLALLGRTQVVGDVSLSAGGDLTIGHELINSGQTRISAGGRLTFEQGRVDAASLLLEGDELLALEGAFVTAQTGVQVSSGSVDLAAGSSVGSAGQPLAIVALDTLQIAGQIQGSEVTLSGTQLETLADGLIVTDSLSLSFDESISNAGSIVSDSLAPVVTPEFYNSGLIVTELVDIEGDFDNSGTVSSANDLAITADQLVSSGQLLSEGQLTLTGSQDMLLEGTVSASTGIDLIAEGSVTLRDLTAYTAGDFVATGTPMLLENVVLSAAGDTVLNSADLSLAGTVAFDTDLLQLNLSSDFTNSGQFFVSGDLELNAAGIYNSGLIGASNLDLVASASLVNSGEIYADSGVLIEAASIVNRGLVHGDNVSLTAAGQIDNSGDLVAKLALTLDGSSLLNAAGAVLYASDIDIDVSGLVDNASLIIADNRLALAAGRLVNRSDAVISASTVQAQTTGGVSNAGQIMAVEQMNISAGSLVNATGALVAANSASINVGSLINEDGALIMAMGTGSLHATASIDNAGQILAEDSLAVLSDGSFTNDGLINAGDLRVGADGSLINRAEISASQSLQLEGGNLLNTETGQWLAQNSLLVAAEDVVNQGLISASATELQVATLLNDVGVITADSLYIAATELLDNADGYLTGTESVTLEGGRFTQSVDGLLVSAGSAELSFTDDFVNAGLVFVEDALDLSAGSVLNSGLVSALETQLAVAGVFEQASGGQWQAQSLMLSAGAMEQAADAVLDVSDSAQLDVSGMVNNAGYLLAGAALDLSSGSLSNSGLLNATQFLSIDVAGILDNSGLINGGLIDEITNDASGGATIHAGDLYNRDAAVISSATSLQLTAADVIDNAGAVYALQDLMVAAGEMRNAGDISADLINIALSGDWISNSGRMTAADVAVTANNLYQYDSSVIYSSGDLTVNLAGEFSNTDSELFADGQLLINAGALTSSGASLLAGADIVLSVTGDALNSAKIIASDALVVEAGSLANTVDGLIYSESTTELLIDSLWTNQGQVLVGDSLVFTVNNLVNDGQILAGSVTGDVTALLQNAGDIAAQSDLLSPALGSGNLQLTAGSLSNAQDGLLQASAALLLDVNGDLIQSGIASASSALTVSAGDIVHSGVSSGSAVTLTSRGDFVNAGGVLLSESTMIIDVAGDWRNLVLAGEGGVVQSLAAMNAVVGGEVYNTGVINSETSLLLTAADVDNAGVIHAATEAELAVTNSLLNNGAIQADTLDLSASVVSNNSGLLNATSSLLLTAQQLRNTGTGAIQGGTLDLRVARLVNGADALIFSESDFTMSGLALIDNAGALAAVGAASWTGNGTAVLENSGVIDLDSLDLLGFEQVLVSGGALQTQQTLSLVVSGDIALDTGALLISQNGDVSLIAQQVSNTDSVIAAAGNLDLYADTYANHGSALLQVGGDVSLDVIRLVNSGVMTMGDVATERLQDIINDGGTLQGELLDWDLQRLSNVNGTIIGIGDSQISAGSFNNSGGQLYIDDGSLTLSVAGAWSNGGSVVASDSLTVRADALNNSGYLGSGGHTSVVTPGAIVQGGSLQGGSVGLRASNITFAAGSATRASGNLSAIAQNILNQGSLQSRGGTVALSGASSVVNQADIFAASVDIDTASLTNAGLISSSGAATLSATGTLLNNGQVRAGTLNASAGSVLINRGLLSATGALVVGASDIDNVQGMIVSGANASVSAGTIDNRGGVIQAGSGLTISANRLDLSTLQSTQSIGQDQALAYVTSSDPAQYDAAQARAEQLQQDIAANPANSDALVAAARDDIAALLPGMNEADSSALDILLSLQTASPDNDVDYLGTSLLYSGGDMSVSVGSALRVEGDIFSGGDMQLNVDGDLVQVGHVLSQGAMTLNVDGEVVIDRSQLATVSTGGDLYLMPDGAVYNDSVYIASAGSMTLSGATGVSVIDASLQSLGNMSLVSMDDAQLLFDQDALLFVGGLFTGRAAELTNTGGSHLQLGIIPSASGAALTLDNFTNEGTINGQIVSLTIDDQLSLDNGTLEVARLIIDAANGFDVAAGGFRANDLLSLTLPSFTLRSGETLHADGILEIHTSSGGISNSGELISRRGMVLNSRAGIGNSGLILSGGNMGLSARNGLSNSGTIVSLGGLQAGADGIFNSGLIKSHNSMLLDSRDRLYNNGTLLSRANMSLVASTTLYNAGTIRASGNVTLSAGDPPPNDDYGNDPSEGVAVSSSAPVGDSGADTVDAATAEALVSPTEEGVNAGANGSVAGLPGASLIADTGITAYTVPDRLGVLDPVTINAAFTPLAATAEAFPGGLGLLAPVAGSAASGLTPPGRPVVPGIAGVFNPVLEALASQAPRVSGVGGGSPLQAFAAEQVDIDDATFNRLLEEYRGEHALQKQVHSADYWLTANGSLLPESELLEQLAPLLPPFADRSVDTSLQGSAAQALQSGQDSYIDREWLLTQLQADIPLDAALLYSQVEVAPATAASFALGRDGELYNNGSIEGGNVSLFAQSITNRGGSITAQNDLALWAWEGDILHEGVWQDGEWQAASLASGGLTSLRAGNDIDVIASDISGASVVLWADAGSINLAAVEERNSGAEGYDSWNTLEHHVSRVAATNGDLLLKAGQDITLTGTQASATGAASLLAGRNLLIESVANEEHRLHEDNNGTKVYSSLDVITQVAATITAAEGASLVAGNDATIIASQIHAGAGDLQLAAGGDLLVTGAQDTFDYHYLKKKKKSFGRKSKTEESETVISNVQSVLSTDANLLVNVASVAANEDGSQQAGPQWGLLSSGDVRIVGSDLQAGGELVMAANGELAIEAGFSAYEYHYSKKKSGFSGLSQSSKKQGESVLETRGTDIYGAEGVTLISGSDTLVLASDIRADEDIAISAGRSGEGSVHIVSASDYRHSYLEESSSSFGLGMSDLDITFAESESRGENSTAYYNAASNIDAGGNLSITAATDVNITGSNLTSGEQLSLNAGRDINLQAGENRTESDSWQDSSQSGVFFSSDDNSVSAFAGEQSQRREQGVISSEAVGSQLAAGTDLVLNAGRDITQYGGSSTAGGDIQYVAQRDINLLAATNSLTTTQYSKDSQSGLGVSVNHNYGNTKDALSNAGEGEDAVSQVSSTLLAIDTLSKTLAGATSSASFGKDSTTQRSTQSSETAQGVTLDAGNNVTLLAGGDARLEGTQANAGQDLLIAATNVDILAAEQQNSWDSKTDQTWAGARQAGYSVGGGASQGIDTTEGAATSGAGSNLTAGNNIDVLADEQLNIVGSDLSAGNDLNLSAETIAITAHQGSYTETQDGQQIGGEVGITLGDNGSTAGYYVEVRGGQSDLDREAYGQQNSHLEAGNALNITSSGDTTIAGAQVEGDHLNLDVGGDLLVSSIPDTGEVDGERWDGSIRVTVGAGFSVSGSGSAGYGETDGETYWVEDQTQLIGRESVDINTEGHTQIDGALVANIRDDGTDGGNLTLTTGSLGVTDIEGYDRESSEYTRISGSYQPTGGTDSGYPQSTSNENIGPNQSPGLNQPNESGDSLDDRTTWGIEGQYSEVDREQINRGTIGEGTITVGNPDDERNTDLASINRDIDQAQEITKDESSETFLYVTESAVDDAVGLVTPSREDDPTTPENEAHTNTAERWVEQAGNYDEQLVTNLVGVLTTIAEAGKKAQEDLAKLTADDEQENETELSGLDDDPWKDNVLDIELEIEILLPTESDIDALDQSLEETLGELLVGGEYGEQGSIVRKALLEAIAEDPVGTAHELVQTLYQEKYDDVTNIDELREVVDGWEERANELAPLLVVIGTIYTARLIYKGVGKLSGSTKDKLAGALKRVKDSVSVTSIRRAAEVALEGFSTDALELESESNPIDDVGRNPDEGIAEIGGVATNSGESTVEVFEPGANISPQSTIDEFPVIGGDGTFITEVSSIERVIGPIPNDATEIRITRQQADDLEFALGIEGNLEETNTISIVDDIADRCPRCPVGDVGNDQFLGAGQGLPGGGSELMIDSIPSSGGDGIRQITVIVE